jgi:hypothetical protein
MNLPALKAKLDRTSKVLERFSISLSDIFAG